MKKHIPTITIFTIIIGIIALGIWYSDKNSPIKQLAKLNVYSEEELSFLEEQGFLNNIDSENLPNSREQIVSLLKSVNLIEQNLNSPDESFEVLATKLDESTYQLAFKLENKSNQSKEFYLIPISESSQTEFKEIKGVVKGGKVNLGNQGDWGYDIEKHKQELRPELAQAYDDIDNNGYTGKPIKLVLNANSTLLAQSKWEISRGPTSDSLKPVYLLVYGSAGGAMDELYKDTSFEKLDKVEKIKKDHFRIEYSEYSEVEIGNLETDDFEPTVKLKKWGDETYIKVSYPTTKKIKPKQEDKKLKWKDDKVEVHFYPLESREFEENGHIIKQLEDGGFEFEIILKEKPDTNVVTLDVETQGLNFYYQRELTQEEKDNGLFMPENVVGSYAVYHETKSGDYEALGGKNYKTGKAFHIYRPRIEDAEGNWTWGELHYDGQTLSTTIPQSFLDNAVYPVRHAAGETFGNGGSGGSSIWMDDGDNEILVSGKENLSEEGDVSQISIYVHSYEVGTRLKGVIYASDGAGGIPGTMEGISAGKAVTTGWIDFPITTTLNAGDYYLGWVLNTFAFGCRVDLTPGYILYYKTGDSFDNPSDPFPVGYSTYSPARLFAYVTYTPAAAVPSVRIKGGFKVKGGLKIKF